MKKIIWIAILTILISVCFLALSFLPNGAYADSMDEPVDQIVVLPFHYENPTECPAWKTADQKIINRWKNAYRWRDSYAICCDEETSHLILAFQDGQLVYKHSYGGLNSGYNNWRFSWQQWQLVRRFQSSKTNSYRYLVYAPHGTDLDKMRQEMQSECEWFMYKFEQSFELYVITPTKLSKDQRDDATKRWNITFKIDGFG